ncbi:MAG TPA: glucokinase [Candidatus Angelobacter sp.]|nr:glucokinase [Candidatus Angelobacter sp.]
MILAGDIGGTHTRIALFELNQNRLNRLLDRVYPSRDYKSLDEIISLFLSNENINISAACFGIAGPVMHGKVSTPNLAWVVDALQLTKLLQVQAVWLINDLQAHASGIHDLDAADFIHLNTAAIGEGNAALIAAGTGLGEAGLYWDGIRHQPFACEGGHCDFAPRSDLETDLWRYLNKKFGRVSYERIVSGPGLRNVYEFLRDSGTEQEPDWLKEEIQHAPDPTVVISHVGMNGKAAICEHALDIFVSVYGAEAGNVALKLLATGGVFLSGGIAARILPRLQGPAFLQSFISKGRMQPLLEKIAVKVVNNDQVGVIGAARYAVARMGLMAVAMK